MRLRRKDDAGNRSPSTINVRTCARYLALTRFAHQYAGNSHDEILKELLRVTDNPTKTRALADGLQQLQAEPPRPQPDEELGDNDGGPSSPPVVGP